jgi:hypothetical protein
MIRILSAASLKTKSGHGYNLQKAPRPGTSLRQLYDVFNICKGEPIPIECYFRDKRQIGGSLEKLRSFYGMDIRNWKRGSRTRPGLYILVSAWNGAEYEEYLSPKKFEKLLEKK